ncbi:MAG TPA: hypothetical protein VHQ39_07380, partial [Dongiaceae bacterium]|nr:hypothetical protein [Dongiaceae bacterium]
VVTSLSKTVAPGLRFGMVAGTMPAIQILAGEIHATSWQLSPLMCEVACRWLDSDIAQRRAAWQRAEVERRYRMAEPLLLRRGRNARRHPSPHVWIPLSGDSDSRAAACSRHGVEMVAGSVFAIGRDAATGLRASITAPSTRRELSLALSRLKAGEQEWRAEPLPRQRAVAS